MPVSAGKKEVTLAMLQNLPGKRVSAWHSMEVNGVTYLVMLTSLPANISLKSVISTDIEGSGQSLMLRWQGEITMVQVRFLEYAHTPPHTHTYIILRADDIYYFLFHIF